MERFCTVTEARVGTIGQVNHAQETDVRAPTNRSQPRSALPPSFPRYSLAVVVLAVAIVALARNEVTVIQSLTYGAYFAGAILVPGRVVWSWIMDRHEAANPELCHKHTEVETWVCGAATGLVLELPSYVVARAIDYPIAYVLGPIGVALVVSVADRLRDGRSESSARRTRSCTPVAVLSALAGIATYLVVWLAVTAFKANPVRSQRIVDPDEMFHLALVGELRHHFPATYPYLEYPGELTYQWFVHVHMAAATWLTGLSPELVYRRFDPLVLTVVAALGVGVLAIRVSRRMWAGPVAMGILVLVGSFDVTGSSIGEAAPEERFLQGSILVHSPTQTFAFVLAIPVILLCLELVRADAVFPWTSWLALIAGMAALSGAKVTFLPIFACGFLAALVVEVYRRRRLRIALISGTILATTMIVLSGWLLYRGDSQSLGFAPLKSTNVYMRALGISGGGLLGELLVTGSLLSMWLLPGAGSVGLLRARNTRWEPRAWWLFGCVASGYGATFLLGHGGNSQLYFGRSSALLVAIGSAWGLVTVLPRHWDGRKRLVVFLLPVGAGLLLFVTRLFTEQWKAPAPLDGKMIDSPVLRLWVNLPVVLLICVVMLLLRMLLRDSSRGRIRVPLYVLLVFLVGLGSARSIAFVVGHRVDDKPVDAKLTFGMDGRRSADWLRAHSSPTDRVLTNAHCGPATQTDSAACDARHFWMSALSERRFVLEGWAYTARSGKWTDEFWGSQRMLRDNDALFTDPSNAGWKSFLQEHPAAWALVDVRAGADIARLTATDVLEAQVPGRAVSGLPDCCQHAELMRGVAGGPVDNLELRLGWASRP